MLTFLSLALVLLRLSGVRAGCAHAYYYPTDICIGSDGGDNDGDDDNESWMITCADENAQPEVIFYSSGDCSGEPDLAQAEEITNNPQFCQGENACTCMSDDDCDVFEIEAEITCTWEDWYFIFYAQEGDSGIPDNLTLPNTTAPYFQRSMAVVVNECIGWSYGDWEDNQTSIVYSEWTCNQAFDPFNSSVWEFEAEGNNRRMPVTLNYYNDSDCTVPISSPRDYYDDNYEYNDTYWSNCDYESSQQCDYQEASGDGSDCSHFLHMPVGVCANSFDERTNGGWGDYDDWNTGYDRRRLGDWEWSQSSEFTCTVDSNNDYTYTHLSYESSDCSGQSFHTEDVTWFCDADNKCNCNAATAGSLGDANDCNIISEGWQRTCGRAEDSESSLSLYVTDACIDSKSYQCYGDNGWFENREYYDDLCENPMDSQCFTDTDVTCDVFATADTSQCGYIASWEGMYAMDVCYDSSYNDSWANTDMGSFMYTCDGQGGFFDTYYGDGECSGNASWIEDYTYKCNSSMAYDCVCGSGQMCQLAEVVTLETCDGEDWSWRRTVMYEFEDMCQAATDPGVSERYQMKTCANGVLDKAIYDDAACTDLREECEEGNDASDSVYESTCDELDDNSMCGYFQDYPLDVCAESFTYFDYAGSSRYFCDENGYFYVQYYQDAMCNATRQQPDNVTDKCQNNGGWDCNCVMGSQCSTITSNYLKPCEEIGSEEMKVTGVCRFNKLQGNNGSYYYIQECEDGNGYREMQYEDDMCTIEYDDYDGYDYNYDGDGDGDFNPLMCSHTISYSADACSLDELIEGDGIAAEIAANSNGDDDDDDDDDDMQTTSVIVGQGGDGDDAVSFRSAFAVLSGLVLVIIC